VGALHAALTVFVVVATANHFWLDGVVGAAVVGACALVEIALSRLMRRPAGVEQELRVQPKASILA
jgi:hypothetical protein